jgi:hypothetical protein
VRDKAKYNAYMRRLMYVKRHEIYIHIYKVPPETFKESFPKVESLPIKAEIADIRPKLGTLLMTTPQSV